MNWLPILPDFRARLHEATTTQESGRRLQQLAVLAQSRMTYLETLQLDRAIGRVNLTDAQGLVPVRVALLSSCTVEHLVPGMRVAGLRRQVLLDVRAGAFGQYRHEVLDPESWLSAFEPGIVLLSLSARPIIGQIGLGASAEAVDGLLAQTVDELRELWATARRRFGAVVVQQSYLDVFESLFGSFDWQVPAAPSRLVYQLNDRLARAAAEDGVLWLDVARASARDGIDRWFDASRWLQGKMEISPQSAAAFGELAARLIAAQRGRSRKCLVLDLDDTLWGGVVGDVGPEGIVLGEGHALGEAFVGVQRYAKALGERGVILGVCSKNDTIIAERVFREHPEMVLRRRDIAVFVANWGDKAENLRTIADQLNIGLDGIVFVDDNAAERARVREALPMVAVPELPDDPAGFVRCIADAGYFEAVEYTSEDRERTRQYAASAERSKLREVAQSMDEFLRGLAMRVRYGPITPVDLARATQLLNKTNQFNMTTRRYASDEVAQLAAACDTLGLQFRLSDRLGDSGLVSVILARPVAGEHEALEIENWVMSCRVFGRQLEVEVMNTVVAAARARGVRILYGVYIPTERNAVVNGLYERLGFSCINAQQLPAGASRWQLRVADYVATPTFIDREEPVT